MRSSLAAICQALWPRWSCNPHPAYHLNPSDAACWVIVGWKREFLADACPNLARWAICRIATQEGYESAAVRTWALAWACREAPHWWKALSKTEVTYEHLRKLNEKIDEKTHRGRS